ncbi:MAG: pyridoxal phosphate-dependent aminotransferase [Deltaproteobacteria bacterium]|nr:pyridoxal phosphate-dependent aminotransferase [Deltaproteobacteria bacterium]
MPAESVTNGADHDIFRPVPRTGVIYVMAEAAARGFRYGHPDWANLGQGAPETGPLPGAEARIRSIEIADEAHEYAPVGGLMALRDAVAQLYNARFRRGMPSQYSAENVAISAGGRTALTRIAASLGNIHLGHVLPDYTAYEELLTIFRAFVPIPIVLDRAEGFALSPARLRAEIVGKGLSAILLSNPCNPTGQAVRGGGLRAWVDIARQLDCALIFDEFYAHYLYESAAHSDGPALSAARYVEDVDRDPVLVVDGLTKNWRYPGWRLAWTLGPKQVIDRAISAGSFLDGGPSHPLQCAAVPLLDRDRADGEARAIQAAFGAKRQLMMERLRAMGMYVDPPPMGAFYCFASLEHLPTEIADGHAFFRAALEKNVIVVPGEFFDVNPGKRRSHIPSRMRQFVRLSFGPEVQAVRMGLDRIDAVIRGA